MNEGKCVNNDSADANYWLTTPSDIHLTYFTLRIFIDLEIGLMN